jgi:glycosyltransferase involved in cell wall biosynthesis
VSPTRYEAYGLGVQEALCCGLPALVSRAAGVAERYPDALRELLLESPDDVEGLAEALLRWRGRRQHWAPELERFSRALRARTWDDMAAEIQRFAEVTASA